MADSTEYTYRVTYANGDVGATCSRRSLGGKIGLSNQYLRRYLRDCREGWAGWRGYSSRIIVKIERAPLEPWLDVTADFERLEHE